MVNLSILIFCTAVVVYIAVRVIVIYNTTSGNRWQRLLATARESATVLWLSFVGFVTAGFNGVLSLAEMAGTSQEVRDAISKFFDARVASAIIAVVVIGGIISRLRTLGKPSS